MAELLTQHTAETGQGFEPAIIERVHALTGGHPWLVNALAQEMVEQIVPDRATPITLAHVEPARGSVIARRDTHFDSLAERLREDRVRKIIEPILQGGIPENMPEDDRLYVLDLGIVRRAPTGGFAIANPIYADVIPRLLTQPIDDALGMIRPTWLLPDGRLDPAKLLDAFLAFWRRHGEALMGAAPYHETAPHLVMMAGLGEPTGWLVIFDRRPKARKAGRNAEAKARKTPSGRKITVIRA